MGYGFGGGMVVGLLVMIGVLLVIALGIWALATWLRGARSQPPGAPDDHRVEGGGGHARDILEERYARGELSTEEYLDRLHTLGG